MSCRKATARETPKNANHITQDQMHMITHEAVGQSLRPTGTTARGEQTQRKDSASQNKVC